MIERIYILLEIFSIIFCLFYLYGKKLKLDIYVMGLVTVDMVMLSLIDLGYLHKSASLLVYFLIFIFCLLEFEGTVRQACVNNLLYILVVSLLQLICVIPMAFINNLQLSDGTLGAIINGLVLISICIFRKSLYGLSKFVMKKNWMTWIGIISCIFMMIIVLFRYKVENVLPIDIYVAGLLLIILVVLLMQKWQNSFEIAKDKEMELEVSKVYIQAYEELVMNMRKRQHDINNQLNAIYSQHFTCHTYDELVESQKEYCGYIEKDFEFYNLLTIKIPVLGGFLYSKFKDISERGIKVESDIKICSNDISVPIYEIIAILGVLLDNAVEAAEQLPDGDKIIMVSAFETEKDLRIAIKNKWIYIDARQRDVLFEEGYSSKGENRGYGLSNVKEKALKYGFGVNQKNEKIEGENWVSFELIFYK